MIQFLGCCARRAAVTCLFLTGPFISSGIWADSVSVYLENQGTIRVYVSPAPGFGHQAATFTVMEGLRSRGFRGEFEVVYADAMAEKLAAIEPGFDSSVKSWQALPSANARFIALSSFSKLPSFTKVSLGITGAEDAPYLMDPAKLHVENFLRLQPMQWGRSYLLKSNGQTHPISTIDNLGFKINSELTTAHIKDALTEMRLAPSLAGKVQALELLLNDQTLDLGLIYGVGLLPTFAGKLRYWVESLALAKRSQASQLQRKTILPIVSKLNEFEQRSLAWELRQVPHDGKIVYLRHDDPDLPQLLDSAGHKDIILIQLGSVSQKIFNILMKRSRIPVLVAGKNAMNLAREMRRAYVNTAGDHSLDGSSSLSEKSQKILLQGLAGFDAGRFSTTARSRTARLINSAMQDGSEIHAFFNRDQNNGRDKVYEALTFLVEEHLFEMKCIEILQEGRAG